MVSPLNAADLSGLPPATVILAEIDPLQSQGAVFAQALIDAGVDTTFTLYQGVTHEFFGMGAVVDKAVEAVAEAATRLKASFGS
jgi:acetyl esterase